MGLAGSYPMWRAYAVATLLYIATGLATWPLFETSFGVRLVVFAVLWVGVSTGLDRLHRIQWGQELAQREGEWQRASATRRAEDIAAEWVCGPPFFEPENIEREKREPWHEWAVRQR